LKMDNGRLEQCKVKKRRRALRTNMGYTSVKSVGENDKSLPSEAKGKRERLNCLTGRKGRLAFKLGRANA